MGFFSMNEHSSLSNSFEFPVVEGYNCDTIDCGMAIVEGYQNDFALFEAAVKSDMSEMVVTKEGGDLEALQEASLSGAWEAIKAFFKKLGAKIKALFTSFMAKFESYITKDTKAYVKKYEKSLNKDYKGFKAKYAEPKKNDYVIGDIKAFDFDITAVAKMSDMAADRSGNDYEAPERSDVLENIWKGASDNKVDNAKDFDEYYHDSLYDSEEVKDDWDIGTIKALATRLSNGTTTLNNIKKASNSAQASIKKVIDGIDKLASKYSSQKVNDKAKTSGADSMTSAYKKDAGTYKTDGSFKYDKTDAEYDYVGGTRAISEIRMNASCIQEMVLHVTQTIMKEAKWGVAQDKRIFAKAVAYKAVRAAGESTLLLDIIGECAEAEVNEYFENPVVA